MHRYRRIMSAREKCVVEQTKVIPKNFSADWEPFYPRGTVVFVFDRDEANEEDISKCARGIADVVTGPLWYLDFDSSVAISEDISGNWKGAKVMRDTVHIDLGKVIWTPVRASPIK